MEWLAKRGLDKIIPIAGIEPYTFHDKPGITYPIFRLNGDKWTADGRDILRWKNQDSSNGDKYCWIPAGLGDRKPKFYLLPGVTFGAGYAHIASGEPDVWTFHLAGLTSVFSTFGEASRAVPLAEFFRVAAIRTLVAYPDRDEVGDKWAHWLKEQCEEHGVVFQCFELPFLYGDKGDINLLWQARGANTEDFLMDLRKLPTYHFRKVEPAVKPKTLPLSPTDEIDLARRALAVLSPDCDYETWTNIGMACHELDSVAGLSLWDTWSSNGTTYKAGECEKKWKTFRPGGGITRATLFGYADELAPGQWRPIEDKPHLTKAPKPAVSPTKPELPKVSVVHDFDPDTVIVGEDNYLTQDDLLFVLPMPFANIAAMGGFAETLPSRKVVGIVGLSGGLKTTVCESLTDFYLQNDYSGVMHGPEWSAKEYYWRALQRMGGPSYQVALRNEAYWRERKRFIADPRLRARGLCPLTADEVKDSRDMLGKIRRWPGNMHYTKLNDRDSGNVNAVLDALQSAVDYAISIDDPLSFAVIDYAQLLSTDTGRDQTEQQEQALGLIKSFGIANNLVTFVASQVTKNASKNAKEDKIDPNDMQRIRSDKMNLVLMFLQQNDKPEPGGYKVEAYVGKNSIAALMKEPALLWFDTSRRVVYDYREKSKINTGNLQPAWTAER